MLGKTFVKYAESDPFTDIYGQDAAKKQILSALIMNRHVVLVGPPGIGKTTLAKNIARLLPDVKVNQAQRRKNYPERIDL